MFKITNIYLLSRKDASFMPPMQTNTGSTRLNTPDMQMSTSFPRLIMYPCKVFMSYGSLFDLASNEYKNKVGEIYYETRNEMPAFEQ